MVEVCVMPSDRAKAARDALAFYIEAGVDMAVVETANDWLSDDAADQRAAAPPAPIRSTAEPGKPRPRAEAPAPLPRFDTAPLQAAPPGADAAVMAARDAARAAASLDELRDILDRFEGCTLKTTASRLVFADGNPQSRLMFVGEAPGRDEDIEGLPFVGRSGKLLDQMLAAIGLDRTQVYIANIVPWRPPGNRTPTPVEGIVKNRGRWYPYQTGTREIRAMPMLHPAYLLRTPLAKRFAWRDFRAIKKALAEGR
jgi:uracil-DNA glycosylase